MNTSEGIGQENKQVVTGKTQKDEWATIGQVQI